MIRCLTPRSRVGTPVEETSPIKTVQFATNYLLKAQIKLLNSIKMYSYDVKSLMFVHIWNCILLLGVSLRSEQAAPSCINWPLASWLEIWLGLSKNGLVMIILPGMNKIMFYTSLTRIWQVKTYLPWYQHQ